MTVRVATGTLLRLGALGARFLSFDGHQLLRRSGGAPFDLHQGSAAFGASIRPAIAIASARTAFLSGSALLRFGLVALPGSGGAGPRRSFHSSVRDLRGEEATR